MHEWISPMHSYCKMVFMRMRIRSVFLFFIMFSLPVFSQPSGEKKKEYNPEYFFEELFIMTDRGTYISGEEVWLKVWKTNGLNHAPCDISKVVYLELLDKNNFPVRQLKFMTDGNSGSSGFTLPYDISSGNYLIRAYTSWMKNFPADLFCYKEITVINPFEKIENLKPSSDPVTSEPGIKPDSNTTANKSISHSSNNQLVIKLVPGKYEYSQREKVNIVISVTDMAGNPVEADMSVSVTKKGISGSVSRNSLTMPGHTAIVSGTLKAINDTILYLPELEGLILSGNMRLKSTHEPIPNADLSLSYIGKTARNQFGKTDYNGGFYFLVKEPGLNEIVIQPLSPDITGYYVELNQPFLNSFNSLRVSPLNIDTSKIRAIDNAVISMQVFNIYEPLRISKSNISGTISHDFFGKPENTIKLSDYIELTSVREVVKEIIPNVYTLKQNGKYDFKLINKFKGQPFENKPLVLVDGVPVYDLEKVLSINSKDIERTDVINTRYFCSELVFDGIISFISRKGDLSAMEFDNSVFRQVYESCQAELHFHSPDYSADSVRNSHIPDFRNTLYWNPSVNTKKDGKTEAVFYTSDESAEYTITVEGMTPEGKRGFSTSNMIVK